MSEKNDSVYEFKATPVREMFYNEDSSWGTYKVETDMVIPSFKEISSPFSMNGEKYEGNITGKMQQLNLGMEYNVSGTIEYHPKYGGSVLPITISPNVPKTVVSQKLFLESLITPRQASTLIENYPNIVEDIIQGIDNVDFDKLNGINETIYEKIKTKVIDNFIIADILSWLSPLGVTFNMIKRLTDNEPNPYLLKKQLYDNPYILTKVDGLGFVKVDTLALKINPKLEHSNFRAIAYIKYYLTEMGNDTGHTWIDNLILRKSFVRYVPQCEDLYDTIINEQREKSTFLHIERERIGLKTSYLLEESIVNRLFTISDTPSGKEVTEENIEKGIMIANAFQGFDYDEDQIKTIREAIKAKVTVIHGVAGSSKTSTARGILNVLKDAGYNIGACALSAKAGIVIEESTGFNASTIHRMFGLGKHRSKEEETDFKLMIDVLLTDEASMTNAYLFNYMLSHIQDKTVVIIVGDDKQLPSIGAGSILRDLISIGKNKIFNLITLTKIYRQALASGIIKDANMIRQNKMPFSDIKSTIVSGELKDMFYMFFNKIDEIHQEALKKYYSAVEKDGIENVCLMSPMKEGINGVNSFNEEIQEYLLGESPYITSGDRKFRLGARVMQIKNDYEKDVMNGETGVIISVDTDKNTCVIQFGDKKIPYTRMELLQIQLGYSCSVHKKQGDSNTTCILVLDKTHSIMLDSCLLYTGITRAKKRCMVISDPYAFRKCISTNNQINRNTYLKGIILKKIKERETQNSIQA